MPLAGYRPEVRAAAATTWASPAAVNHRSASPWGDNGGAAVIDGDDGFDGRALVDLAETVPGVSPSLTAPDDSFSSSDSSDSSYLSSSCSSILSPSFHSSFSSSYFFSSSSSSFF